jgi:hypothetical protein
MKTERRHELATNELADWLGDTIERVKPYSTAITGTVLACALLAGAYVYYTRTSASKIEAGWSQYFDALDEGNPEALRGVADEYATTPAGHWSRLSLADSMLAKGVQQLFEDRDAAEESLKEAVAGYTEVIKQAPRESLLAERATFGLAEAFESLGELSQAREQYNAVLEHWKQGAFTGQAEKRLADLDRDSTQEFYDWFANQHPKPKRESGGPDLKPRFGKDDLDVDNPLFDLQSSDEKKKKKAAADDSLLGSSPFSDAVGRGNEKPKKKQAKKDAESGDDQPDNSEPNESTSGEPADGEGHDEATPQEDADDERP